MREDIFNIIGKSKDFSVECGNTNLNLKILSGDI